MEKDCGMGMLNWKMDMRVWKLEYGNGTGILQMGLRKMEGGTWNLEMGNVESGIWKWVVWKWVMCKLEYGHGRMEVAM